MGSFAMRALLFVLLGVLIAGLLLASPVLAVTEVGTEDLEEGDVLEFRIDNTAGETLWIEYDIRVLSGSAVDILFVPQEGHIEFFDPDATEFTYYPDLSVEDSRHSERSWSWEESGYFYLIIDNRYSAPGTTTVEYTITWEADIDGSVFLYLIVISVIIVLVIIVVIVISIRVASKSYRERKSADKAIWEGPEVPEAPPTPPAPYPDWVVERSELELGHEWDPERDEPS
jgi:hypothetical protein